MKTRQQKILSTIMNSKVSIETLLETFNISRRTLYYDISYINEAIKNEGKIISNNHYFTYVGDIIPTDEKLNFYDINVRDNYILFLILTRNYTTIEDLSEQFSLSKNTIVASINRLKEDIKKFDLEIKFDKTYFVKGSEIQIRNLFILLSQYDFNKKMDISEDVKDYSKKYNLELSDYSLSFLTSLVEFIKLRHGFNKYLTDYKFIDEVTLEVDVEDLIKTKNIYEQAYLKAYIMTLQNNVVDSSEFIDSEINKLITSFESKTNIEISEKTEFIINLRRHFLASYYRIKFDFPIHNPLLETIKSKYKDLFKIVKSIIKTCFSGINLSNARDEEIAYIVAYFGGYIYGIKNNKNKVIIVCPNGLVISKTLKMQLEREIPYIDIISVQSVLEFEKNVKEYDFCISTVPVAAKNLIIVNPILSDANIKEINRRINYLQVDINNIDKIIEVVEKHASINDLSKLKIELTKLFYQRSSINEVKPMLDELLTKDKINKIKSVKDYKEAILVASKPLLDSKAIEEQYVTEMYNALEKFGPYIVLADRFALPHATSKVGVNEIGMSILVVEEEVDLLGKPVNIFCVLASIDNESHLKALASLSELLYEQENIEKIINSDVDGILKLIKGVS